MYLSNDYLEISAKEISRNKESKMSLYQIHKQKVWVPEILIREKSESMLLLPGWFLRRLTLVPRNTTGKFLEKKTMIEPQSELLL